MKTEGRLLQALRIIETENKKRVLLLGDLLSLLGEMGHGILSLLLCLFFLQPIPLPGVSAPIGIVIFILAWFQFLNLEPWIPERFRSRPLPQKATQKIVEVAEKIWIRLEKLLKPRLLFLNRRVEFRLFNFCVVAISAILLSLPLPIPFTNTVPAIVIIAMSLGHLEEDGVLILFSYIASLAMLYFFYSLGNGVAHFFERLWASYF